MWMLSVIALVGMNAVAGSVGPFVTCTFDEYAPNDCVFYACNSSTVPWVDKFGGTASAGSGPENDHTKKDTSGHYKYVEASGYIGKYARYASAAFEQTDDGRQACVAFYYHMHGAEMGSLRVYEIDVQRRQRRKLLWEKSGNRGDKWHFANVAFESPKKFQVVFEAKIGPGTKSDIAIDDVTIRLGNCTHKTLNENYLWTNVDSCIHSCRCESGSVDCQSACACVEADPDAFCTAYVPPCERCTQRCKKTSEQCLNVLGGPGKLTPDYRCECASGYERTDANICADVNECITGRHNCSASRECCVNVPGGYWCHNSVCPEGWNAAILPTTSFTRVLFISITAFVCVPFMR